MVDFFCFPGGWGGIRTPGSLATSAVFKTVAFDRSANHPKLLCAHSLYSAHLKVKYFILSLRYHFSISSF